METTTVPVGAAQGILGFIKVTKEEASALTEQDKETLGLTPTTQGTEPTNFDIRNLWHLKVAPIGGTLIQDEVVRQPIVSLANPIAVAPQLAAVLTHFKTATVVAPNNSRPEGYKGQLGGKKRHAKTAHKRKQGRSRKIRKSKK
jgi:hypothetical protein